MRSGAPVQAIVTARQLSVVVVVSSRDGPSFIRGVRIARGYLRLAPRDLNMTTTLALCPPHIR